ncbi:uncharacterized protein LOC133477864 isoform X2 [Phyllopteryx taeniolatus]|uniref:uncharacterized protein LOC133477864 isoform X2 n=1 Tax=Phyllopteryx taeniolatus TaxID=161469 RepID=UPI002AD573DF|nr:uncharacterized protein LOC133477864 isoform X2 [Phyllopteryx taeniolatus]
MLEIGVTVQPTELRKQSVSGRAWDLRSSSAFGRVTLCSAPPARLSARLHSCEISRGRDSASHVAFPRTHSTSELLSFHLVWPQKEAAAVVAKVN